MFSRLLRPARSLRLLTLTLSSSALPRPPPPPRSPLPISRLAPPFLPPSRTFSSDRANGGDGNGKWKLTPDADEGDSIFGEDGAGLSGITDGAGADDSPKSGAPWTQEPAAEKKRDIFEGLDQEFGVEGGNGGEDAWETAEGYKPWTLGDDDDKGDVFGIAEGGGEGLEGIEGGGFDDLETEKIEEQQQLEKEKLEELEKQEKELLGVLKGPDWAFGDLIAASGITEDMIDSLILLKDVRGVKGLPPLSEIEDKAIARMNRTSSRAEIERKKQEEIASTRVRQVDEKGRAYGTGRRKCSVARVWIQPGDGKFLVNDKQFDAFFPIIDHRADLLRPFTVTNTLGLWDVNCTVKGGGVSGQVGAVRLGISRALQNWEPGLRPYLKAAGYLTRDPRVVERKKPGKAKARKSFQWVKR